MSATRALPADPLPSAPSLRSEPGWLTPLELAVLGAIWGASFLFMRVAAPEFGAFALVEVRLLSGAMVLLPFLWLARRRFPLRLWAAIAGIAAINTALPFVLFAWAAGRAPAGIGAIANAMTVPFTALVGHLFFQQRIGPARAAALAVGFVGVVVLASGRSAGASVGLAAAAGTLAAFCYGLGVHLVRRHLGGLPPAALACATLLCASLMTLPLALWHWPAVTPSPLSWAAAVALGVLCTGLALVGYYRLVERIGPARTSTVTYLIPLFAVAWAWWLLDEPVTMAMLLAGALVLGSVAVSQRARD
ncbi:DMT family transporter [Aquimonas voraii]|uniref:Threonine/homoserine efflux transporter RhtA n=1 Tax=Aquimonas voraii TaxID=265719 RepID=A0A1G6UAS5_9GAMM|nr:DMT family transporter [Aquimonas voraii]SDD38423.1 Threonine/homoserine efflux transporter RhtA [Aquimonas voraii]